MTLFAPRNAALAAGLALALACAPPATAQAEGSVLPGYWESTNSLTVLIPQKPTVTRKCLSAEEVQQWITGPSNRHYTCTYARRRVGGGHVSLGGDCVDRKGRKVDVEITGTYAPERFHLQAAFHYRLSAGVAIPGVAVTDARRLSSECPAAPGAKDATP